MTEFSLTYIIITIQLLCYNFCTNMLRKIFCFSCVRCYGQQDAATVDYAHFMVRSFDFYWLIASFQNNRHWWETPLSPKSKQKCPLAFHVKSSRIVCLLIWRIHMYMYHNLNKKSFSIHFCVKFFGFWGFSKSDKFYKQKSLYKYSISDK